MPSDESDGVGIGELSRQVQQVLIRFEGLATRLETQFVRVEAYEMYKLLVDQAIKALQENVKTLATLETTRNILVELEKKASKGQVEGLEEKVEQLEDDRKWIVRLILGFIVLTVMGAIFVASDGSL